MTYRGIVKNGVVELADADLPDGTEVDVAPVSDGTPEPTIFDKLAKLAGRAQGLPTDMARNHDHYLHGAPRK